MSSTTVYSSRTLGFCFKLGMGLLVCCLAVADARAATVVATYRFNDTLAADELGVPALTPIDPLGANQFEDATVDGNLQRVYRWEGTGDDPANNAGLQLDATGLVSYNNYSIELVFEFLESAEFGGGWRRIVDTQNRLSDNGFYVDPNNQLQVYPVVSGSTEFTTPGFHHVLLSNFVVSGTREVKAYLDGVLELTSDTDQLNLDNDNNPGRLLNFFVDNFDGPNQEFADGRIAFLRLYNGIVVPEPSCIALLTVGLLAARFRRVRCLGRLNG